METCFAREQLLRSVGILWPNRTKVREPSSFRTVCSRTFDPNKPHFLFLRRRKQGRTREGCGRNSRKGRRTVKRSGEFRGNRNSGEERKKTRETCKEFSSRLLLNFPQAPHEAGIIINVLFTSDEPARRPRG